MIREGVAGDLGRDGWVAWTTADDDWSYNASLSCGDVVIVLGHGVAWGATSDERGVASIHDLATDEHIGDYTFPWCSAGVEQAAAAIAERCEHPAPQNVVAAARELWFALMQEGCADA